MDMAQVAKATGSETDQAVLKQIGQARFVGALRFDSSYAELAGIVRGAESLGVTDPAAAQIGDLPASTVGALSVSGVGELINKQWAQIMKSASGTTTGQSAQQQLQAFEQNTGVKLPEDLVTLLGKNITLAVDEKGLDGSMPNIGGRLATDPAKAQAIVAKLEQAMASSGIKLGKASGDGTYVLASTQAYADELAKDGTLGDDETFQQAVPNADDATFALYVDLNKVEKFYLNSLQGDERTNLKQLRAVGLSGKAGGSEVSFSLRVLFD
jgi:hypothetical protein